MAGRKFAPIVAAVIAAIAIACSGDGARSRSTSAVRNLLIVTIDTLRTSRVGAYGYKDARTPAMDALAGRGTRFESAYATAPITLTSHASLMTGRYPPGHGARDNGMRLEAATPTLAESLSGSGFVTAAFVAAFPLDKRFGLDKGFRTYGDRIPRGPEGRIANERPGRLVVDEALAWLNANRHERFFLWVHLFEPHAPYGTPGGSRSLAERYDDEVAEADRQVGRLVEALGDASASTLIVATADHGEAFGEHGEIGHSIFVYDTTLRVPLILAGPSIPSRVVEASTAVSLVDVAPTVMRALGTGAFDADGIDLTPVLNGEGVPARQLYAESFAPLLQFGWSPLRTLRADGYKYIAAPRPELYDINKDSAETKNVIARERARAASMDDRVQRVSSAALPERSRIDEEAGARLQALGYASGRSPAQPSRADPKDRRELAARIAQVTSGELSGDALERALRRILADDPDNPQAHLRLGYVLLETRRWQAAEPHFRAAIAAQLPSADAHLGLARCRLAAGKASDAIATLRQAEGVEPGNPVVLANLGIMLSDSGQPAAGVTPLLRAIEIDPDFHQARFNLAVAFARADRRQEAATHATELLRRLPPDAPQRPVVERLLAAVR